MINRDCVLNSPNWRFFLTLICLHFTSVYFSLAFPPFPADQGCVIWIPNALLLASLLYFEGKRSVLLFFVCFSSDFLGNLIFTKLDESFLLSNIDMLQVIIAYNLMKIKRKPIDAKKFNNLKDWDNFIISGPLAAAAPSAFLAAYVQQHIGGASTPYLILARVWWFSSALGLIIYTPLLLEFAQEACLRAYKIRGVNILTASVLLFITFTIIILSYRNSDMPGGITVTPVLLLPIVALMPFRLGAHMTMVYVSLISIASTIMLLLGFRFFQNMPVNVEVIRIQEFILSLGLIGVGFSILIKELKNRESELEAKVLIRTAAFKKLSKKLEELSTIDGLTGIYNRRMFDNYLTSEWNRAKRDRNNISILLLDVDMFKQYNDHYGHPAGDDVLRKIAMVLSEHTEHPGSFVSRYGGEEFAIIIAVGSEDGALEMAKNICISIVKLNLEHEMSPYKLVTASVGVASITPGDKHNLLTFLNSADQALYRAKQLGRNRAELAAYTN